MLVQLEEESLINKSYWGCKSDNTLLLGKVIGGRYVAFNAAAVKATAFKLVGDDLALFGLSN